MNAPDFLAWVRQRDDQRRGHVPDADRLVPLIAQAGQTGVTRTQLGHMLHLEPAPLDALLDGLVASGILTKTWEAGNFTFRTSMQSSNTGRIGRATGIYGQNIGVY